MDRFLGATPETAGIGGHTTIALGRKGDTLVTLGYNRDAPGMDGFGVQELPVNLEPTGRLQEVSSTNQNTRLVMFQRVCGEKFKSAYEIKDCNKGCIPPTNSPALQPLKV